MQKNGPLALAFNALVITFMLAPLLVVCIVAFTPHNTLTLPTTEFSLRWFKAVFEHSDFVQSFWNSLWLALASATLATVLAVPAGIAITRYDFPGRGFLNGLFLSPLIIPHLVLGVALLRLFALLGGTGSFGWLVFAHALIVTPYTLRLVVAALVGFDRSAEHAALSLQATPFTTLRRIVLPQVLPGILSGSLIVFGLAASSFAIPGLLGGRRLKMVATVVYDEYLHELNWPLGAAIALTLLVANLVVMLSYNRLVEGRYKKALG